MSQCKAGRGGAVENRPGPACLAEDVVVRCRSKASPQLVRLGGGHFSPVARGYARKCCPWGQDVLEAVEGPRRNRVEIGWLPKPERLVLSKADRQRRNVVDRKVGEACTAK